MQAPVAALAGWTLLVWGGRIRNAVAGDDGAGAIVLAVTFVVLAVVVLVTRGRDRRPVLALAAWTMGVWAVRAIDIALVSDHGAAFIVVHVVLAVVSMALALLAARAVTRNARARLPVAG